MIGCRVCGHERCVGLVGCDAKIPAMRELDRWRSGPPLPVDRRAIPHHGPIAQVNVDSVVASIRRQCEAARVQGIRDTATLLRTRGDDTGSAAEFAAWILGFVEKEGD